MFRKRFLGKGREFFKSSQWHFQLDNAPVHNSILVTDNLTKKGIKTVPHPPYCPDFAPCDFCLFPKLRGCRFERIGEMKEAVTEVIDTLTQEDFHGAFQKLLERYNKCIAAGGDYFEGDLSFMCVLSIKVPVWKKSGNLLYPPRILNGFCRDLHHLFSLYRLCVELPMLNDPRLTDLNVCEEYALLDDSIHAKWSMVSGSHCLGVIHAIGW